MEAEFLMFPDFPDVTQTVTIGQPGRRFRLRLFYRPRLSGWYMDLSRLDGTPILVGVRLVPGVSPGLRLQLADLPSGVVFFVAGRSGYARDDLGAALFLRVYDRPPAASSSATVTVEPIEPVEDGPA